MGAGAALAALPLVGGPEDDLIEAGPGSDRLNGKGGADAWSAPAPPTSTAASTAACWRSAAALVGGPGRDDTSFAEIGTIPTPWSATPAPTRSSASPAATP